HGFVEARVRVQVSAKAHADRLEIFDEIVLGEMLRAIERGVLEEVSETEFVIRLQPRAGIYDEPKLGALFRPGVLADVVLQAVRQLANAELWVDWKARRQIRTRWC